MANNPKPSGLSLIKWLSFLLFLGFGFIGFMSIAFLGMGTGNGRFPVEETAYYNVVFLFVASCCYFFIFVLLNKHSRVTWFCVNGFWLSLLFLAIGEYLSAYFDLQSMPVYYTYNYTYAYLAIFGFPIFFITICLIYFQTLKVKEYFGVKKKQEKPPN